jgi:cytochrome c oxidase cbb3-type subunit I/II
MLDPESMSPGSIMPSYPWLFEKQLDTTSTRAKITAMRTLGVPYPEKYEDVANAALDQQAHEITARLQASGIEAKSDKEIIALIAYLQRLGIDIKVKNTKP